MKPYYQDSAVTLYHGDCREIVPTLGMFDLLFTDPPYNVGKKYGEHNDSMKVDDYFEWCSSWLSISKKHCSEISLYPPKKHFLWFWNQMPTHRPVICTWRHSGAFHGKWIHQYAPLLLPAQPKVKTPDHWDSVQVPGMGYFFRENKFGHPGYTSEDITRHVISCLTDTGGSILDIFGGTGTTGRAAKDLGRKCTMIEREERYCEIAAKRMAQEVFDFGDDAALAAMAESEVEK
jgi:site-specific DNA-methyltransferase (adenine-specific)